MKPPDLSPEERRRLTEVFGDDASDQTADDLPEAGESTTRDDDWWRAQRPPHHGG